MRRALQWVVLALLANSPMAVGLWVESAPEPIPRRFMQQYEDRQLTKRVRSTVTGVGTSMTAAISDARSLAQRTANGNYRILLERVTDLRNGSFLCTLTFEYEQR